MPSGRRGPSRTRALTALLLLLASIRPLDAQIADGEWNSARSLDLISMARSLRARTAIDPDFRAYSAEARGYVYYFLDRPDVGERTLVKTDQIALDVYWRAPRETRQRIVGLRDEKKLPTTIKYHLDHLTVVQDDFGDRIRLGDGDEVEAVIHPVAPASQSVYDFRLTDSLTLSFAGPTASIRVYEVEVRPKNLDAPGIVGRVFLERETGAIVRMSFTFTPTSYVDTHLDYIRISLDNSLWDAKYWLPYRQEVEIRREVPLLEFVSGGVIRGRFDIRGYEFNPVLPTWLFNTPQRVSAAPDREDFAFETGLYDQLDDDGLVPPPSLDDIRRQAVRVVGRRYISGIRSSRFYVPSVSSAIRYNRAEGYFSGLGVSFRPAGTRIATFGGYAYGREKPHASISIGGERPEAGTRVSATLNALRDVGPIRGASGVLNSLSLLADDEDFTDPYFSTGISVAHSVAVAGGHIRISGRWERHRSAEDVVDEDGSSRIRPVRSIDRGDGVWLQVDATPGSTPRKGLLPETMIRVGRFEGRTFAAALVSWSWTATPPSSGFDLTADLHTGWVSSDAPSQMMFLLGGRFTLPGYDYRSFVGDRMTLVRVEATQAILAPWFRLRLFASSGVAELDRDRTPADWLAADSDGIKTSVGAGLGLGWDILRLDAARGVNGGDWELIFSVNRGFWRWL